MWLLRTLLLLLWCSGYRCNDCNMTKAYFESQNFYTVVHWDAVDILGQEVRYHVQYIKYGKVSMPITGCQNISVLFCDLTSVLTDVRSRYYVKIMVNDICGQYLEFTPFKQTNLGAPELSTSVSGSSLTVRITAPMGPRNHSIDKVTCWEKCQGSDKTSFNYIVHLTHPESEAVRQPFENKSGTVILHNLELGKEYCGIALYQLTHPAAERSSEGANFCVTLPAVGKPWVHVLLIPGLVVLFLFVSSALVVCQIYITRKSEVPKVLIMSKSFAVAHYPDPQVEIASVKVCSDFIKTTETGEPPAPPVFLGVSRVVTETGYAAQDHHDQPWHCQSYTNQQVSPVRTCDTESSTSYSMVMAVSAPHPDEPSQFAKDSCAEDSIMSGTSGPMCAGEDCNSFQVLCNPQPVQDMSTPESSCDLLVLPVSRDPGGNLMFSSIFFQSGLSFDLAHSPENTPPVTGSTPAGERCPLLGSELGHTYRRAYLPNQTPLSCSVFPSAEAVPLTSCSDSTSNYRQNWVPGISPETRIHNSDCTVRAVELLSELKEEEEEEEEEEDETRSHFGSIALGGWMVQIQG